VGLTSTFGTEINLEHLTLPELPVGEKYFQYLRMDVDIFEELYALVEPKNDVRYRPEI